MDRIFRYIDELPGGSAICHGDLHPKNLFNTQRGYIAIDWADVYCGNPASDVARTALILAAPHTPANAGLLMRIIMKWLKKTILDNYLAEYIRLTGMSFDAINSWLLPVAAGRLKEDISGERQWLMDIIYERTNFKFKPQNNGANK
jgi:aminoglycoside phosphotransferase (APT) family kinase protein